jgi:hypothetical protein
MWFTKKKCSLCRSQHAACVCGLKLTSTSYKFGNKGQKSIKILKIWWKKDKNSKMGNGIYLKIAGYVDLDMLHNFAVKHNF